MPPHSGDIPTIALDIDRLMRRIHAQLQKSADQFDTHNVGPLGGMVLLTIADGPPAEAQMVAQALGRDKSQVSRLLKRLEDQGLIARERSAADGRATLLTLTEDGQRQLDAIKAALSAIIGDILHPLSPSEQEVFGATLAKLAVDGGSS